MIKKSKSAVFSDLHLGIHNNSEDWHNIALNWADWITADMKKRGIVDVLFLGDFFDNRSEISVQTMHVASEILDKFKDFNIIMVVGNHDAYYKNRSDVHSLGLVNGYKNITVVDKNLTFSAFGKDLLFVPWNNELADGKFDYIFGHFEIQSFKMNNYKVCDKGLQVMDFLASKTDRVFSGHFHRRDDKKYNEGSIYYVGNTFPMDFGDTDNIKGYYILDIESGKLAFVENTISPKFKKLTLSALKSYTKEDVEGNIVKLIIDLEVDDSKLDKFKTYLGKFNPLKLIVEHNTTSTTINNVEEIDSIDLVAMFDEFIKQLTLPEDQQTRVENLIKELYQTS